MSERITRDVKMKEKKKYIMLEMRGIATYLLSQPTPTSNECKPWNRTLKFRNILTSK